MTLNHLRLLPILAAALACSACVELSVDDTLDPAPATDPDWVERAADPGLMALCPRDRFVARMLGGGGCPTMTHWKGRKLFNSATPWLAANPSSLPTDLAKMCVYTPKGGGTPSANELFAHFGGRVGHDCNLFLPQAAPEYDAITEAVAPMLEAMYLDAAGHVDAGAIASVEHRRQGVTIAIVDTHPFHYQEDPRSPHGDTMRRLAAKFACPAGEVGCAVRLDTHLGLPLHPDGIDFDRGGLAGSPSYVAGAIWEALRRWEEADRGDKLIINLSLGWNPVYANAIGGPGAQLVQDAITAANCAGALVIAPAGNEDDSCVAEPLLPGGAERSPQPSATACTGVGYSGGPPAPLTPYDPSVHSVGGLSLHGGLLETGRPGGMPRLAAPGSHIVIDAPHDTSVTVSGTSGAAATVTGIAALIWSFRPLLTREQVMAEIYGAGDVVEVGLYADYRLTGLPNQPVRAVDACEALAAACAAPGACGGLELDCSRPPAPTVAQLFNEIKTVPSTTLTEKFTEAKDPCSTVCGDPETLWVPQGGEAECPDVERDPYDRYASPMPATQLTYNGTFDAEVGQAECSRNPKYDDKTITSVVVSVEYADGTAGSFPLGAVDIPSDEVQDLDLDVWDPPADVIGASITIKLDDLTQRTDELILKESPF